MKSGKGERNEGRGESLKPVPGVVVVMQADSRLPRRWGDLLFPLRSPLSVLPLLALALAACTPAGAGNGGKLTCAVFEEDAVAFISA